MASLLATRALRLQHTRFMLLQTASKVSVANVKVLRQRTELPMKLCRQALEEAGDSVDAALAWLNDNEEARAELAKGKLADRAANQGRIAFCRHPTAASLVQVNCETDFVARNDNFAELVATLADECCTLATSRSSAPFDIAEIAMETLLAAPAPNGSTLRSLVDGVLASVGENVSAQRAAAVTLPGADTGVLGGYIHLTGSHGGLVALKCVDGNLPATHASAAIALADKVAQNVVALDLDNVDPADMTKFVVSAPYIFDSSKTIGQLVKESGASMGVGLEVAAALRWVR